jgi:5'-deoxynucleotidase YfbR-like HD superfamily hydrolase
LDIVVLLGRYKRFGNNGDNEFSVLHHSVLVAIIWMVAGFPLDKMVYALGHDFHEAYTGDIPSPIKNHTPEVRNAIHSLEDALDSKIWSFLGVEPPDGITKQMVKVCDKASLIIEMMVTGPPGSDDISKLKEEYPDKGLWELIYRVMPNLEYVSANIKQNHVDRHHFAYGETK